MRGYAIGTSDSDGTGVSGLPHSMTSRGFGKRIAVMTYAQQKRYERLRDSVADSYNKWQSNTDREMDDTLFRQWMKANERMDNFLDSLD